MQAISDFVQTCGRSIKMSKIISNYFINEGQGISIVNGHGTSSHRRVFCCFNFFFLCLLHKCEPMLYSNTVRNEFLPNVKSLHHITYLNLIVTNVKSVHHITCLNLIVTNSIIIVRTLDTLTVFIHFFCLLVSS